MELTPPGDREIEVSVVGRGYGECVIVHAGCGEWLIVDSCVEERGSPNSYATKYLDQIGVSPDSVRWLLASHWHDDHVAGFTDLVDRCAAARVYFSEAMRSEEFVALALVDVDEPAGALSSGIAEMRKVLRRLKASERKPEQARADQRLHADTVNAHDREIWALSPSNAASLNAKASFAQDRVDTLPDRRRISAPSPNESSVALLIWVGDAVCLLGADLQTTTAADRGWEAVLASEGRPRKPASIYKVAHHGAPNGDTPQIWEELLERDVVAALTPYGAGVHPRPDDDDVRRICARTADAYLAGPRTVRRTKASAPVEKMRRRAGTKAVISERPMGHVRARFLLDQPGWTVSLHGEAQKLCSES